MLLSIYQVKVIALETPDLLTVRDEGRLVRICTESLLFPGRDWGKMSAWTQSLSGEVSPRLGDWWPCLGKQIDIAFRLLVAGQEVEKNLLTIALL